MAHLKTEHLSGQDFVKAKKVAQQDVETEKAKQQKLLIEAENRIKLVDLKIKEKMKQGETNKAEALSLTPELLKKWP